MIRFSNFQAPQMIVCLIFVWCKMFNVCMVLVLFTGMFIGGKIRIYFPLYSITMPFRYASFGINGYGYMWKENIIISLTEYSTTADVYTYCKSF